MKSKSLFIFKITLSFGILSLLFFSTNLRLFINVLLEVDFFFFFSVPSIMVLGMIVSVYKWQSLLVVDSIKCGLWTLARFYLIGIYLNNFLPTSIGGDAMRIWLVSQRSGRGLSSFTSVIAERFSGFLALLLVTGFLSLNGSLFLMQKWLGIGLILIVSALVFLAKGLYWSHLLAPLPDKYRLSIGEFFSAITKYCRNRHTLWVMVWTSLIYPFLVGLIYYCAGRTFSVYIPFFDLVVISSLVTLLTLVPVSLNGLGLREGGFVYFLGLQGVPQTQALSLTLLVSGLTLMLSLLGGVLLLFERGRSENDR